jgi:hypothetical protein
VATSIVNQSVRPAVPSAFEPAGKPHASVYEIVTSRILAGLENGQVPWRKPSAHAVTREPSQQEALSRYHDAAPASAPPATPTAAQPQFGFQLLARWSCSR